TDLAFWTTKVGIAIPPGTEVSDPRAFFDTASQRWFASTIDYDSSNADNRFLLAVSASADPTGTWRGVAFTADPVNGYLADFPTFGIDSNGVYLSGDMFDSAGNPTGPLLVSIPKSGLLANPPNADGRTSFGVLNPANYGEVFQPVVSLGGASSSEAVLAVGDLGYDYLLHSNLVSFAIQNASSAGAATLGSPAMIAIPVYSVPLNPRELGAVTNNIDDGDARINAIVYRLGDVLYATHGTEVSNRAAVQWFKINALTRNVIDTGIIA